ncbi:ribosomal RNA small subunit methyltransferase A [Candidatus Nomurabacteria bacterium]|nr:ribosomal RNA small subunit methyltransferase A [Candidatus Nomurabacteria bacterium]
MLAKKSLGQNWLRSERVARQIIATANLGPGETVLEIGPGQGFLTKFLLETGARVIAVEKDDRLIELLQGKFAGKKLNLIHGDILELEIDLPKRYKLVANLPYYITGQALRQFLESENQPEKMVLMLQDEVAKRIVAKDGKESLLSIAVKAFGQPKYVEKVLAKCFTPIPKVHSAILSIEKISKDNFIKVDETKFFEIVKRGFGSKRKMLRNHLNVSPVIFTKCGISETGRAENLTLENWLCLAEQV